MYGISQELDLEKLEVSSYRADDDVFLGRKPLRFTQNAFEHLKEVKRESLEQPECWGDLLDAGKIGDGWGVELVEELKELLYYHTPEEHLQFVERVLESEFKGPPRKPNLDLKAERRRQAQQICKQNGEHLITLITPLGRFKKTDIDVEVSLPLKTEDVEKLLDPSLTESDKLEVMAHRFMWFNGRRERGPFLDAHDRQSNLKHSFHFRSDDVHDVFCKFFCDTDMRWLLEGFVNTFFEMEGIEVKHAPEVLSL